MLSSIFTVSLAQSAIELGCIYALVALALFVSFSILNIADLSTDGCFTLGCAVCAMVTLQGHPFLGLLAAMGAGVASGFVTAFLQTRLGVESILAGIIVNTGLYTINIAVMGFSAGGIQAGEFLMHYDEDVNGTALDSSYVPDELDQIPAHASADGMIYSFYGRLSVGNMDPDWLSEGDLPPTFYVYGTEDPFYDQFEEQYDVIRNIGIQTSRIVLNGWPHGFGSDGGWIKQYADWLEEIFKQE